MTKAPRPTEKSEKQRDNTKNARRQPSSKTDIPDRGFADTLSGFLKH